MGKVYRMLENGIKIVSLQSDRRLKLAKRMVRNRLHMSERNSFMAQGGPLCDANDIFSLWLYFFFSWTKLAVL